MSEGDGGSNPFGSGQDQSPIVRRDGWGYFNALSYMYQN